VLALTFARYHILAAVVCKEYLTIVKKLSLVIFCCNFWTFQQKPRDYICSGCKNMVSQKCAVFIGPPCTRLMCHSVAVMRYPSNMLFLSYFLYFSDLIVICHWLLSKSRFLFIHCGPKHASIHVQWSGFTKMFKKGVTFMSLLFFVN